jgi:hypothetical protein
MKTKEFFILIFMVISVHSIFAKTVFQKQILTDKEEIYVKMSKQEYKIQEPIYIDLVITNICDTPLIIRNTSAMYLFDFKVSQFGKKIPETLYGIDSHMFSAMTSRNISIPKSTGLENRISINRCFDMSRAGKYIIEVARKRTAQNIKLLITIK